MGLLRELAGLRVVKSYAAELSRLRDRCSADSPACGQLVGYPGVDNVASGRKTAVDR